MLYSKTFFQKKLAIYDMRKHVVQPHRP